jgi:hypothetical protein
VPDEQRLFGCWCRPSLILWSFPESLLPATPKLRRGKRHYSPGTAMTVPRAMPPGFAGAAFEPVQTFAAAVAHVPRKGY